jgi:DNA-binding MarR family transcriptional regulator
LQVSKQGLGQLVGQLVTAGFVEIGEHAGDRRAKVVRRTPEGDRVVRGIRDLLDDVEERWRREVGAERYLVFRTVLAELVRGADR